MEYFLPIPRAWRASSEAGSHAPSAPTMKACRVTVKPWADSHSSRGWYFLSFSALAAMKEFTSPSYGWSRPQWWLPFSPGSGWPGPVRGHPVRLGYSVPHTFHPPLEERPWQGVWVWRYASHASDLCLGCRHSARGPEFRVPGDTSGRWCRSRGGLLSWPQSLLEVGSGGLGSQSDSRRRLYRRLHVSSGCCWESCWRGGRSFLGLGLPVGLLGVACRVPLSATFWRASFVWRWWWCRRGWETPRNRLVSRSRRGVAVISLLYSISSVHLWSSLAGGGG